MKTTSDFCVAFSVDDNYIQYAMSLLRGLKQHCTGADIVCRSIDMSDDNIVKLRQIHDTVKIIRDNPHAKTTRTIFKKLSDPTELYWTYKGRINTREGIKNIQKTMYSERAVYSCHSRFKTIIELLPKYKKLMTLDVDTVIRSDIYHMFTDYIDSELYIVPIREDGVVKLFNNEGLLLITNTARSVSFFNKVHDHIYTGDNYLEWDIDTEALTETFSNSNISIGHLEQTYKDKKHLEESIMWSGDGPRKKQTRFKQAVHE
jgi:lipopolysaccharide biosynthesis glycosyltransferase